MQEHKIGDLVKAGPNATTISVMYGIVQDKYLYKDEVDYTYVVHWYRRGTTDIDKIQDGYFAWGLVPLQPQERETYGPKRWISISQDQMV